MQLSSEEIEQILTRVVRGYLRRVRHVESLAEKAEKITFMCAVGGGTDTCNLITAFEDLPKEILRKINEIQESIAVGTLVNCPDGLGRVLSLEDGYASVHIHTFGRRRYALWNVTIAE